MNVHEEIDTWLADVQTQFLLPITRNPDRTYPPCVFVGMPDAGIMTVGENLTLDLPIWLITPSPAGLMVMNDLLDLLPSFLKEFNPNSHQATWETFPGSEFPSYKIVKTIHICPDTP